MAEVHVLPRLYLFLHVYSMLCHISGSLGDPDATSHESQVSCTSADMMPSNEAAWYANSSITRPLVRPLTPNDLPELYAFW
jgi:hypothetical protein